MGTTFTAAMRGQKRGRGTLHTARIVMGSLPQTTRSPRVRPRL
uniref:Uncharacterized protein n=1 Tax=Anguilla anguilla TaxID=7936 RepID=A0A0E9RWM4_ANGAN